MTEYLDHSWITMMAVYGVDSRQDTNSLVDRLRFYEKI